jgi:hypothetical protein
MSSPQEHCIRNAIRGAIVLACAVGPIFAITATAEENRRAAFEEKLSAGDMASALAICKQVADPAQRDQWLAELSRSQLQRASLSDALATAAQIDSDITRSAALREVVQHRQAGAAGGGAMADFNSLMNLIKSTIAPDSWDDQGGEGAISPYRNGVLVDAEGLLRRMPREQAQQWLARFRANQAGSTQASDVRRDSPLRKVSLTRLERAVELRRAAGKPLDPEMLVLAGLERIQYILVYPETGDLVLAGPAGNWQINHEGRTVSLRNGHPIVRLDDLITVFRYTAGPAKEAMGCSITPLETNLAAAKAFLDESQKQPLKRGGRARWLEEVRRRVGRQRVDVFGVDPTTSVARVLVEADYHMKLVGLGLEESVVGVPNYLSMIELTPGEAPPAIDVLRWWFTMKYDAIEASPQRDAFAIVGQAVQLQSENEMLNDRGQQIHTNQAEPLNRRFAENFTRHFAALAQKYPVYAELQNLFDLALVGTLIETEGLADQVGWHRTYFGVDGPCQVPHAKAPAMVETVANHRVIGGRHIIAAVSGGVHADAASLIRQIKTDRDGQLDSEHRRCAPLAELPRDQWWWD